MNGSYTPATFIVYAPMPSPPPPPSSPLPSAALDAALAAFEARVAGLAGPEHTEARKV
jgi:hypothetical protein